MGHTPRADSVVIRPRHDDRPVPAARADKPQLNAPIRVGQFSGHAVATDYSLSSAVAEPVDRRLTVSFGRC